MRNIRYELQQDLSVYVNSENVILEGKLTIPKNAESIVVFAHGSGSSKNSPRNKYVAGVLNKNKIATLLIDLLTYEEERIDLQTRELRFNIPMLAKRLVDITNWIKNQPKIQDLRIGYFGSSTGGAAALVASVQSQGNITAVVSRGGRPDLAGEYLEMVKVPTLLITGENDPEVIKLNKEAMLSMNTITELKIIPKAGHLFEEPGKLEIVAGLATEWFKIYSNTYHD